MRGPQLCQSGFPRDSLEGSHYHISHSKDCTSGIGDTMANPRDMYTISFTRFFVVIPFFYVNIFPMCRELPAGSWHASPPPTCPNPAPHRHRRLGPPAGSLPPPILPSAPWWPSSSRRAVLVRPPAGARLWCPICRSARRCRHLPHCSAAPALSSLICATAAAAAAAAAQANLIVENAVLRCGWCLRVHWSAPDIAFPLWRCCPFLFGGAALPSFDLRCAVSTDAEMSRRPCSRSASRSRVVGRAAGPCAGAPPCLRCSTSHPRAPRQREGRVHECAALLRSLATPSSPSLDEPMRQDEGSSLGCPV